MAKKLSTAITHTLIIRKADGEKVTSTGVCGDLSRAKRQAYSALRIDLTGMYASVDVYRYDPQIPWQQLQPLATVTLDDEVEVEG